jgi:DNA-binding MarR family transcriptional regulator
VLAVQHLARAGELTPGQLGALLQLSSGGTTGLIQRLQRAGHVSRHANTRDRRSVVVRLTPAITDWAADAWAPYVAEVDALAAELSHADRDLVRRFLEGAADAAERHAERLARDADETARDGTPWQYLCAHCGRKRRRASSTRDRSGRGSRAWRLPSGSTGSPRPTTASKQRVASHKRPAELQQKEPELLFLRRENSQDAGADQIEGEVRR